MWSSLPARSSLTAYTSFFPAADPAFTLHISYASNSARVSIREPLNVVNIDLRGLEGGPLPIVLGFSPSWNWLYWLLFVELAIFRKSGFSVGIEAAMIPTLS
jgi:hypothetical protein